MRLTSGTRKNIVMAITLGTIAIVGLFFVFALNLFASINAVFLFILGMTVISGLIYFYTGEGTGPLGLRGKYAKPFGRAAIVMIIGVMFGFLVYFNLGVDLNIWGQIPVSTAGFILGVLFGMITFLRLYRRDL